MGISVNWIDVLVLILLVIGTSVGLFQGLVRQTFFIASTYVSIVLAAQYHQPIAEWLSQIFPGSNSTMTTLAALGILFLICCIVLNGLTLAFFRTQSLSVIATVDHVGGALLGAVTTWVILTFALSILFVSLSSGWPGWEESRHGVEVAANSSYFRSSVYATMPFLSETIRPWLPAGLPAILHI